jgi:hypothetical protein
MYQNSSGSWGKLAVPILELLGEWQYITDYAKLRPTDKEVEESQDLDKEIKECESCAERQKDLILDEGKLKEKRLHRKICQVEKNANIGPFYYGVSVHIMTKMNLTQPPPLEENTKIFKMIRKSTVACYKSEGVEWQQRPFPVNVYNELDLEVTEGDRNCWEKCITRFSVAGLGNKLDISKDIDSIFSKFKRYG